MPSEEVELSAPDAPRRLRVLTLAPGVAPVAIEASLSALLPLAKVVDAGASGTGLTCQMCGLDALESREAQRAHFASDWHRLNARLVAGGRKPLASEEDAVALLEGDSAPSLSGSATSESDSDAEDGGGGGSGGLNDNAPALTTVALATSEANNPTFASMFAQVVASHEEAVELWSTCTHVWVVVLFQAGHFAAGLFENGVLTRHNSYHRYVTRRKQGGAQSAHDNKGHKAKSAGAQLRRYGEESMTKFIEESFLGAWYKDLARASRIFLAVPQRKRPVFVAQTEQAAMEGRKFFKGDSRLRRVPFITRRPTVSETERVYHILATVRIHGPPTQLALPVREPTPQHDTHVAAPEASRKPPSSPTPEALKERNREQGFYTRPVHEAAAGNDVSLLQTCADMTELLHARNELGETPFLVACRCNCLEAVSFLLNAGANPADEDFRGRVGYLASTSKAVRLALREFRGAFPDRWDWARAQIPEPPAGETPEQREARLTREKAKRKEKKERAEAEKAQQEREAEVALLKNSCSECRKKLPDRVDDRFFQGGFTFCSAGCLRAHARRQAAEAFDRRMAKGA